MLRSGQTWRLGPAMSELEPVGPVRWSGSVAVVGFGPRRSGGGVVGLETIGGYGTPSKLYK